MEKQVLSINQCKELVALGLDMSDASMCWSKWEDSEEYSLFAESKDSREKFIEMYVAHEDYYTGHKTIPTYTLQNILEKIPESILGSTKQVKTVEFKLCTRGNKIYYMQDSFSQQWLKSTYGNNLLEAAFEMLKWCKQNNYI